MKISIFKSTELSDNDWQGITDGFNQSFDREKKPAEQKQYYQSNVFGYSYHAICKNEEGRICGHSSIIPIKYLVGDDVFNFGQSGGSFVLKEYRSEAFMFLDLSNALKAHCAKEGLKVTYGVSNKKSFKYAIKILKCAYIKDLDYHLLPVSLSKLLKKDKLAFIDILWRIPLYALLLINRLASTLFNNEEKKAPIRLLVNDAFVAERFDHKYQQYKGKNTSGIYRLFDESGVKTAYIMDFRQDEKRTYRALVSLISHIIQNEKVDAILFIGDLTVNQKLLFKIPEKRIPQRFPLTLDYLDDNNKEMEKLVLDGQCWDFSLINFDVR